MCHHEDFMMTHFLRLTSALPKPLQLVDLVINSAQTRPKLGSPAKAQAVRDKSYRYQTISQQQPQPPAMGGYGRSQVPEEVAGFEGTRVNLHLAAVC